MVIFTCERALFWVVAILLDVERERLRRSHQANDGPRARSVEQTCTRPSMRLSGELHSEKRRGIRICRDFWMAVSAKGTTAIDPLSILLMAVI